MTHRAHGYPVRVAGIPAQAEVLYRLKTKGTYSPRAETPDEYYGADEIDFRLLDRRGYPAPWLERKLTKDEIERVEDQIRALEGD